MLSCKYFEYLTRLQLCACQRISCLLKLEVGQFSLLQKKFNGYNRKLKFTKGELITRIFHPKGFLIQICKRWFFKSCIKVRGKLVWWSGRILISPFSTLYINSSDFRSAKRTQQQCFYHSSFSTGGIFWTFSLPKRNHPSGIKIIFPLMVMVRFNNELPPCNTGFIYQLYAWSYNFDSVSVFRLRVFHQEHSIYIFLYKLTILSVLARLKF